MPREFRRLVSPDCGRGGENANQQVMKQVLSAPCNLNEKQKNLDQPLIIR